MKNLSILFSMVVLALQLNAQSSFTMDDDTSYSWGYTYNFDIPAELNITNITDTAVVEYVWKKKEVILPGGWEVGIEDKNNMFIPSISEQKFILNPGETGNLNAHFYPDGSAGEGSLSLLVYNAGTPSDSLILFYSVNAYTPNTNPTISSISPSSGNAGQTLDVTITGLNTNFSQGSGTTVDFSFLQGSSTVNSINIINNTSLVANVTIPSNTVTDYYDVTVYDDFDGYLYLYSSFYINGVSPPSISSISPSSGNAGQTLDVTITGSNTNFSQGSGTTVDFSFLQGSSTVNSVNVISDSSIVVNVTIPSNTYSDNYYVTVYNYVDGYLYDYFYVNGVSPPSLSSISPSSGNAGQTLDVTITGVNTNFSQGSGTTVDFSFLQGSSTVNSINVINGTSLVANVTIPSNTVTDYYDVIVYDDIDGYLYDYFYVNGVSPPSISSISPSSGNAGQTLDVTITGSNTNFSQGSGTTVDFSFLQGSSTVNSVNVISDSSIVVNVTIPSNTYSDNYYVTVYNYVDGYLYDYFYVNGVSPPSLSSISPSSGNAGQTLDVTITGSNTSFTQASSTTVYFEFYPSYATINSINIINDTSLVANVTIPSNTYTGNYDVSVYNDIDGYLTKYNSFYVNYIIIWPGDVNNNSIVNQYDIFGIGLNFNDTVPKRDSIDINWFGHLTPEWSDTQKDGTNKKHADCNGDGKINQSDIQAIINNFGATHSKTKNQANSRSNPDLYFDVITQEDIAPGSTVEVAIMAGKDTVGVSAYGIGFEFSINLELIKPGTFSLDYSTSWIGANDSNFLSLSYIDSANGTVYSSSVRTDKQTITNKGEIARLSFIVSENITDTVSLIFEITESGGILSTGDTISFNHPNDNDTSITIIPTSIFNKYHEDNIVIYPNPATNTINIVLATNYSENVKLTLYDVLGQAVITNKNTVKLDRNHFQLKTQNLKDGIYLLELNSHQGKILKKINIINN